MGCTWPGQEFWSQAMNQETGTELLLRFTFTWGCSDSDSSLSLPALIFTLVIDGQAEGQLVACWSKCLFWSFDLLLCKKKNAHQWIWELGKDNSWVILTAMPPSGCKDDYVVEGVVSTTPYNMPQGAHPGLPNRPSTGFHCSFGQLLSPRGPIQRCPESPGC